MSTAFRETLKRKEFIITAECGPVKGTNIKKMLEHIKLLKDNVDALNVTDNQSAVMRYPSLGTCVLIKEQGGEPIFQVTCRDRNRLAIQADLLFAYSRGIDNVLCLTGDSIDVGDHKQAKPVFDLDSIQLIHLVHNLNAGKDMAGNKLDGGVDFCIGASATPSADPIEPQLIALKKKLDAEVDFIQTQAIYDLEGFKRFMEHARKIDATTKILAGIVLLVGAKMASFMNRNIPGFCIPEYLIDELAQTATGMGLSKGMEICARLIRQIKDERICDGVHIMAIGREEVIPRILSEAGAEAFGVGTAISNAPTVDFAMDIVEMKGKPVAKRGKLSGKKQVWRCPQCLTDVVKLFDLPMPKCPKCGSKTEPMLKPLIRNGKIVAKLPRPKAIRKYVLRQLERLTPQL